MRRFKTLVWLATRRVLLLAWPLICKRFIVQVIPSWVLSCYMKAAELLKLSAMGQSLAKYRLRSASQEGDAVKRLHYQRSVKQMVATSLNIQVIAGTSNPATAPGFTGRHGPSVFSPSKVGAASSGRFRPDGLPAVGRRFNEKRPTPVRVRRKTLSGTDNVVKLLSGTALLRSKRSVP
jgi:hypothetical protein